MMPEIIRLKLLAPLFYARDNAADPFGPPQENGERLFCFEVEPSARRSFEPREETFLGPLLFGGKAETVSGGERLELPGGSYLFAQERARLNREEIIRLAIETQKEGLWQCLDPGPRLYLRYLFEDGREVTQVFRPYGEGGG
jgi:hypothetical protein